MTDLDEVFANLMDKPADIVEQVLQRIMHESPDEYRQIHEILLAADGRSWIPLPGAQTMAYNSEADVVGYGGAAGGGKTALAVGLAVNEHSRTAFFRREGTQLEGVVDYLEEVLGTRDGYNSQKGLWRLPKLGKKFEFCSTPHPGDEAKYQGRAKDLLVVDEAANFLESQVRFIMGWMRSTDPNQRVRTLLCFNPPTTPEGYWVKSYFAPWLDPNHTNPAVPGELRWYVVVDGHEREVPDDTPVYDAKLKKSVKPQSRTFIPAKVTDNPYLVNTGYMTTLQSMPEPLRSQMLYGDFSAGIDDHEYQVIPTAWVDAAMERWPDRQEKAPVQTALGVDVSRGGRDSMILAPRYGWWYDTLKTVPPDVTANGRHAAAAVMQYMGKSAIAHVDGNGIGSSVVDHLQGWGVRHTSILGQATAPIGQVNGIPMLKYGNFRAMLYWEFRCLLDPNGPITVSLPPDSELLADLTAPRYRPRGNALYVESKDEIFKRLGRSTDKGDAVVYASNDSKLGLTSANMPESVQVKHSTGTRTLRPSSHSGRFPKRVG